MLSVCFGHISLPRKMPSYRVSPLGKDGLNKPMPTTCRALVACLNMALAVVPSDLPE